MWRDLVNPKGHNVENPSDAGGQYSLFILFLQVLMISHTRSERGRSQSSCDCSIWELGWCAHFYISASRTDPESRNNGRTRFPKGQTLQNLQG